MEMTGSILTGEHMYTTQDYKNIKYRGDNKWNIEHMCSTKSTWKNQVHVVKGVFQFSLSGRSDFGLRSYFSVWLRMTFSLQSTL